jgi:GNAT superfamily N-acetyltransferase
MEIRPAALSDLAEIYNFDPSFNTEYVWQLQSSEDERSITVHFDTVRLPRTMKVECPRIADSLFENWQEGGCFLVAEEDKKLLGFITAAPRIWLQSLWVNELVIHKEHRRKGIGSALLRAARQWALQHDLKKIMLEAQSKNYPAICFARKLHLMFCGFIDRYFAIGVIAVFFSLTI